MPTCMGRATTKHVIKRVSVFYGDGDERKQIFTLVIVSACQKRFVAKKGQLGRELLLQKAGFLLKWI